MGVRRGRAVAAPVATCHHLRSTATSCLYQLPCATVLNPVLRRFESARRDLCVACSPYSASISLTSKVSVVIA
jgi:hypothetical protein